MCPCVIWVVNDEGQWSNKVIEMNHKETYELVQKAVTDLSINHIWELVLSTDSLKGDRCHHSDGELDHDVSCTSGMEL